MPLPWRSSAWFLFLTLFSLSPGNFLLFQNHLSCVQTVVTTLLVSCWCKGGEPGCWEGTHHAHTTKQSVTISTTLTVTSFEYTFKKVHVVVSLAAVTPRQLSCVVRDHSDPLICCSPLSLSRSTMWTNQKVSRRDVDYTARFWPGGIGVLISRAVLW